MENVIAMWRQPLGEPQKVFKTFALDGYYQNNLISFFDYSDWSLKSQLF